MISDALSELDAPLTQAEADISDYLEHDGARVCYQAPEVLADIVDVLGRLRDLRARVQAVRVKLDNPFGYADPAPEPPPCPRS